MVSIESHRQELEFTWAVGHHPHNLFSWTEQGMNQFGSWSGYTIQMIDLEEKPDGSVSVRTVRESVLSDKSCTVLQAKVLDIESQLILVIITENNVQFHDIERNCVLYTFIPQSKILSSQENDESTNEQIEPFARGITYLRFFIFIGLYSGSILVLSRLPDGCVTYEDTVTTSSTVPITDIFSDDSMIVTGDAEGGVTVREPDGQLILKNVVEFEGFNSFPCTGVVLCGDDVVASYGSGHIRIFSVLQRRLLSEIHAHLSWINCIDVKKDDNNQNYFVVTGSDDSMIRVWRVCESYPWVRSESSFCLKNMMVIGVSFFKNSTRFAAVAYDSLKLFVFDPL